MGGKKNRKVVKASSKGKKKKKFLSQSGRRGVTKNRNMWRAIGVRDGKRTYIGTFPTIDEASHAVEAHEEGEDVLNPAASVPQSGRRGVTKSGNKWQAIGVRDGKRTYIGLFSTIDEASNAVEAHEEWEDVINPAARTTKDRSGERGVFKDGNKWISRGRRAGEKDRYIGRFSTVQLAKEARDAYEGGQDVAHVRSPLGNGDPARPARQARQSSGHRGVSQVRNRWAARGHRPNEKQRHIGMFDTIEEAANAVESYEEGEDIVRPARPARPAYDGQ
jgi:hypothetical protein